MKKADVELGAVVTAKSEEELKKPFQGTVEKIYENSALLAITSFDDVDATAVSDLNYKLVVNFKNMKPAKAAKKAYKENISLKEACVSLGFLTAERFDEVFHPENMI